MELSEILNVVLGGSLIGAVISIVTIRSALKKARAEAEKALAESDTVKITNTEHATRILIQNIVEPLREELNETRKELSSLKREVARFRKAVASANSCRYSDECPVLERMRDTPKGRDVVKARSSGVNHARRQRDSPAGRQRKRGGGDQDGVCEGAAVGGDADDSDGQPAPVA
ncbi:MAG: hypothetical protein IJ140_01400 [Prevotella sp.]|nr:hypothetical protein [Prevotella sp.]